ncbi:hypothetical protein ACFYWP_42695 [Actinacidiphila glaucinigra]|uniref:hypothetical protein n=1 Tax=Actinacidiphila glaucinigra TaxID=235986 RepID=UPI0036B0BC83
MGEELNKLNDDIFVRRLLWVKIPQSRPEILALEEQEYRLYGDGDEGSPGMYSLISGAFVRPILIPLLQAEIQDRVMLAASASLIEDLLASRRPAIGDLVTLRITDVLLGETFFQAFVEEYGGPLLKSEVEDRVKFL